MKKYFFSIAFCMLITFSGCAQKKEVTTVILVRHAEKADDGTRDPFLSDAGKERAQALVDLLRETKVDAIYTTAYNRTRETVAPLAIVKSQALKVYAPKDKEALKKIMEEGRGKTIVMVGHSNTIPWVANELLGEEKYPDWGDDDYDNVLIVSVFGDGDANVAWLNYGKASGK